MSPQAQLIMVAWLPIIFYLFTILPSRKAVIVSFIVGSMFLPQKAGFRLPLIPDYTGIAATSYGIIFAMLWKDFKSIKKFRFGWTDLPMLIWCISPFFSSMSNDLGAYDGINELITQTVKWGLPYFFGRIYLNSLAGMREFAITLIQGGLLYVPLVLYESRMSPQLHKMVFGYWAHASGLRQASRLGGWRPMVFMEHGLMLGMWMMTVAIVCFWLWNTGAIQKIWGISIKWLVLMLIVSWILCKSSGTYVYFAYGLVVLFVAKWFRNGFPLLFLIMGIFIYLFLATSGNFDGDSLVSFVANTFNPDRAQSLEFRFDNEEILIEHARKRILFGWGGWGRNRVFEENWQGDIVDTTVTDSLWIITFGINGLVGLVSLTSSLLLPVFRFCFFRYPARTWLNPKVAPAASLAVVLTLFVLNCLINAHLIAIYPMISGGLSGLVCKKPEKVRAKIPKGSKIKRQLVLHK